MPRPGRRPTTDPRERAARAELRDRAIAREAAAREQMQQERGPVPSVRGEVPQAGREAPSRTRPRAKPRRWE